jgi:hypothetical protein
MKKYILLFVILTATAASQSGVLRAGYGLQMRRDSVMKFSIHPPTLKVLGDSIGFGGKDTVTFSAGYLPEICPNQSFGDCDTSGTRVFTDMDGGNWLFAYPYVYPRYAVAHATGDWRVRRIAISNTFFDPSLGPQKKDTLFFDTTTITIPRGSTVYIAYTGADSYVAASVEPRSDKACQQVGVYYLPPINSSTITQVDRYNAHKPFAASTKVQVPLMLGATPRGLRLDGYLLVTITLVQK